MASNSDRSRLDDRPLSVEVSGMDLDLSQVRAFVVAADELHFGRAAARLLLAQQVAGDDGTRAIIPAGPPAAGVRR